MNARLGEIVVMPYRQSPHQIKPKHTLDKYNPDGIPRTIMLSTSLPNMILDNDGSVVGL